MYQKGQIRLERHKQTKKPLFWLGRWRENLMQEDGTIQRVQRSRKLADYDSDRYRCASDVRPLLDRILRSVNETDWRPTATTNMLLSKFIGDVYLPFAERQCRASTYKGYRLTWSRYIQPRVAGIYLRDFRPVDGKRLLDSIAASFDLSTVTLQHIKAMLSGVFTHAKNEGLYDGVNPMRDVELPKARGRKETFAYSLEEIIAMLDVLPEPARTIVALASLTGLREGEVRGLNIEDYSGTSLNVCRSVWRSHEGPPKGKSAGLVPVIKPLAELLDLHVATLKRVTGPMFRGITAARVDLDRMAHDIIRPALEGHKLVWHGWHACRRGLATNLHDLGIDALTIQAILRQSDVAVTERFYIKRLPQQSIDAMHRLEAALTAAREKCAVSKESMN